MNRVLIVYFDNCCYGRLFDINAQTNVKAETAKIRRIIRNRFSGKYIIIGSLTVIYEIRQMRDARKRGARERLYNRVITGNVRPTAQIFTRAAELESKGLKTMDARHLASAEAARVDYLLTVDLEFINKCSKPNFTTVKVINPIDF